MGERFFDGLDACLTSDDEIAIGFAEPDQRKLTLSAAGVYLGGSPTMDCSKPLEMRRFYKEGWSFDEKHGSSDRLVITQVGADVGKVTVTYLGWYCNDTGVHLVQIDDGRGSVVLRDTLTVELLEHDVDGDGVKELYLFSEQACSGWLRVFRLARRASKAG